MFLSQTAVDLDWPEPEGTPPKLTLTGSRVTIVLAAERRFSRPAPIMLTFCSRAVLLNFLSTFWSAVLTMAERICSALQLGCSQPSTAADPARCGVAMEVPWKKAQHGLPLQNATGIELSTVTPGATTSGCTR